MLLVDPLSTLDSGFWLSFLAVSILAILITRSPEAPEKLFAKIFFRSRQWIYVQLFLTIGMAPVLILFYGQVSIIAPIANLLAIPVVTLLVIPPAMMGLLCFVIGLEQFALTIFGFPIVVLELLMRYLVFLENLPGSVWATSEKPVPLVLLGWVGLMIFKCQIIRFASIVALMWIMPVLFFNPSAISHGEFRYTMLDVGQGLASVVQTANHSLVFDAGPKYRSGFDAGRDIVLPYLRHASIDKIDVLIVSHHHNDHAGGVGSILNSHDAKLILSGAPEHIAGAAACEAGASWQWDGVEFSVLWPPKGHRLLANGGNNASCVLRIESAEHSLLLTGDIEKEVESILVKEYGEELNSNVLQVPHQGSKTSSTAGFLLTVNPEIALVSAGYKNRFGHPHEKVVNRYEDFDIGLFTTAESGALTLEFGERNGPDHPVSKHRDNVVGYWYN